MVRRIASVIILLGGLSVAQGQPFFEPPPGPPPGKLPVADQRDEAFEREPAPHRPMAWRRFWLERDNMTTGSKGVRSSFWQELRNVPTLEKYLREFGRIQKERAKLEQQRREIAQRSDLPSNEALKRFHDILHQEDDLTSQAARLFADLRKERSTIAQEVRQRLENLELTEETSKKERGERVMGPRWRRFYNVILQKLEAEPMASSPNEWLGGIFRDLLQLDRAAEPTVEGALRQLEKLQREQEELRRRMENIQSQLDDLAELLMAAHHGESRRGQRPAGEGLRAPASPKTPGPGSPPALGRGERSRPH